MCIRDREVAEPVPDGPSCRTLADISARHGVPVLAGLVERDGDSIYNTYVCMTPDGPAARFRKIHAFLNPHLSSGSEYCVFDLLGCRVGILICYDNNLVENVRITALMGAEIIFMPHVTGCLPAVMPGLEPVLLPAGVAVDLDQCRRRHDAAFAETLPKSCYPANTYLPALDILFSPNGTVVGPEASKGVIHLLVNDVADSTQKLFPIDLPGAAALNQSDKRVVSLFTRTGYVTTSEIVSLAEYLGTKNQFYYAERGETE